MASKNKRVVVVGGGIGGSIVAKSLQFESDLTLIDAKEYFEIPWAYLRAMVEPPFGQRSVIKHSDYLTNGTIITSIATNITETEVVTADGRSFPYDYLVIACGHAYHTPKSRTARLEQFQEENQKITSAQSILIVGGGPTGVELAGEIAVDYPDKKLTLVHRGSRLLEFIGPKAADKALKWLTSKNIDVKLEKSVNLNNVSEGRRTYQTTDGETVEADCHFLCTGIPLSSAWLRDTLLGSNLDSDGRLMVDENLRIKGRENIFAIGDIADVKELKQGYAAQQQASVAAKNLKLLMKGGNSCRLATYHGSSPKAIVSLGRREAVAQISFITLLGRIPGFIKSRDLFVGMSRRQLGLSS